MKYVIVTIGFVEKEIKGNGNLQAILLVMILSI